MMRHETRLLPTLLEVIGLFEDGVDVHVLDDVAVWLMLDRRLKSEEQFEFVATFRPQFAFSAFVASRQLNETRFEAQRQQLLLEPARRQQPIEHMPCCLTDAGWKKVDEWGLRHPSDHRREAQEMYDLFLTDQRKAFNGYLARAIAFSALEAHPEPAGPPVEVPQLKIHPASQLDTDRVAG